MQEKRNYFWIILPWLPAVIGACCLWGYIVMVMLAAGNGTMEITVAWIGAAAVVLGAIIAGVVALFGEWKQLKRDGKTIDKISDHASELKPKVENIEKMAEQQSAQMDALVSDLDHRKRMEAQYPQGIAGKDMMMSGINEMLAQYEKISAQYQKAQEKITSLKIENAQLRNQNQQLKAKVLRGDTQFREKSDIER